MRWPYEVFGRGCLKGTGDMGSPIYAASANRDYFFESIVSHWLTARRQALAACSCWLRPDKKFQHYLKSCNDRGGHMRASERQERAPRLAETLTPTPSLCRKVLG